MTQFETEVHRKVYDNEHGNNIVVRPDRDGLDLVEACIEEQGLMTSHYIVMPPEQALLVAEAITQCALELLKKEQ